MEKYHLWRKSPSLNTNLGWNYTLHFLSLKSRVNIYWSFRVCCDPGLMFSPWKTIATKNLFLTVFVHFALVTKGNNWWLFQMSQTKVSHSYKVNLSRFFETSYSILQWYSHSMFAFMQVSIWRVCNPLSGTCVVQRVKKYNINVYQR